MKKAENIFLTILFIVCVAFFGWMFVSWLEVIRHNVNTDIVYSAWNFFILVFG